jgi:hypothetical protein
MTFDQRILDLEYRPRGLESGILARVAGDIRKARAICAPAIIELS